MTTAATNTISTDFHGLADALRRHFERAAEGADALFLTDATELFAVFLDALPEGERQSHTCHACRRFVDTYGRLVSIDAKGVTRSIMWSFDAPAPYTHAVRMLKRRVERAAVVDVHVASDTVWGVPRAGGFAHMSVRAPSRLVFAPSVLKTVAQRTAERRQEFVMLSRGLISFSAQTMCTARRLLEDGSLYRSEKCVGVATWLVELVQARAGVRSTVAKKNLVWRAVATAPVGWAHVRSGMIGALLEDIEAGMPMAMLKRRFDAKMDPLRYQRPQAAPKAGNVAQAEAIVAALRSEGALDRRFAGVADIRAMWRPSLDVRARSAGGIFSGLARSRAPKVEGVETCITWAKFQRTALRDAASIEVELGRGSQPFYAFVTATHPSAAPILQWDSEQDRNPVSWYTYSGGSTPKAWGLQSNTRVRCVAISSMPFEWTSSLTHQGRGVMFVLERCRDTTYSGGAGYFPEQLKAEYHPVRATMEAHAKRSRIARVKGQVAAGLVLRDGGSTAVRVRVARRDGTISMFRIDRWD